MLAGAPAVQRTTTTGGDVPGWLKALGVGRGGFYTTSKARAQRMMKDSLTAEARQVYACLELATMGFQQERAVTMDKGRIIPLRSEHISQQTGLSKQHVRRAIADLEGAGLAERRSINGKPLTQGNIEIYSWAIPRETKNNGSEKEPRAATSFALLSPSYPSVVSFAKTCKILPPDDLTESAIEAARGYFDEAAVAIATAENAEEVAIAKLKTAFAQATANKEERNVERNIERNPPSDGRAENSPPVVEEPPAAPVPEPPARPPDGVRDKDSPLRAQLRAYLSSRPIPTRIDGVMFDRIARWITTAEELEGFKKASDAVEQPRKWAVYASIAEQVHGRGQIPELQPSGESALAKEYRERMERLTPKPWPTS